jgi:hypothetical protein
MGWVTIMRALVAFSMLMLMSSAAVHAADAPKLAVFALEMIDASLQGEVYGPRADEHDRLMRVGDQLRQELGESDKFQIVDISPANVAAHQSNLQACGGCDAKLAQLDADLSITVLVQKGLECQSQHQC